MALKIAQNDTTGNAEFIEKDSLGNVKTVNSGACVTTVTNGVKNVALAATPEAIGATTTLTAGVLVQAEVGNTDYVYVGDSSVDATNGLELDAGDSVFYPVDDPANLYICVSVNTESVRYAWW